MKRRLKKVTLVVGLAIGVTLLAAPRSAAAFQHDSDDHHSQVQDESARQNQQMDRNRSYGIQRDDDQQGNMAHQYGYQDGLTQGMHDRQSGRRARPSEDANYKQGDRGYESRFGDHDQYRQTYRQAYEQGYDRGYNGNGYNQEDRVNDRGRHDKDRHNNDRRDDNQRDKARRDDDDRH